jgi:hypothetical protein
MEKIVNVNVNNNNISADENKKTEQDVSLIEILENVRKYIKNDDLKNAQYFLNLVKFTHNLEFSTKITTLSLKSLISFKTKNEEHLLKLTRKIFKYMKKHNTKLLPPEFLLIFIKIFFKTAQVCEDHENYMFSCWLYYVSKILFDSKELKGEETTYELIKNGFPRILKKISEKVLINLKYFFSWLMLKLDLMIISHIYKKFILISEIINQFL